MKNTSVQRAESNFRFPQAVAYFDKCHFYFPRLHEHERALLTNRHGIAPWRCEYGWMVVVPRLTPSILRDIDAALMFRDGKQYGTISRIDIAFDWPFQTQAQADAANAFLKRHTIWRYRRNGQIQTWPESGAWASKRFYQGQRPPSKNIECYSDFSAERPPKIDASYACHFEFRFLNAAACRSVGLVRIHDLVNLNPAKLFGRLIWLATHNKAKGPLQRFHDRYPRKNLTKIPLDILHLRGMLTIQSYIPSPHHRVA
jgi:hypothetical protein